MLCSAFTYSEYWQCWFIACISITCHNKKLYDSAESKSSKI